MLISSGFNGPLWQKCERNALQIESALAISKALYRAAQAAHGQARPLLLKWSKRVAACALSHRVRLIIPAQSPSYISIRNKRACQRRYCMICAARKAREQVNEVMELYDTIQHISPGCRTLFLTLTSKNLPASELRAFILTHQAALLRFFSYQRIIKSTLGHLTNIEVDFSVRDGQLMCHVHSHSLIIVESGALSDHRYILHHEWRTLWQQALQVAYLPMVNIKAVKSKKPGADRAQVVRAIVREVCKYAVDTKGFFFRENGAITIDPAAAAFFALGTYRLRLTSMDRIWLTAKRQRSKRAKASAFRDNAPDTPSGPPDHCEN